MADDQVATPPIPYTWSKRRRYLYVQTVFCMGVIAYVLGAGKTDRVAETAVMMAFGALIAFAGSYVFGAAWQDINHMRVSSGGGQNGSSS
jgi:hypothetical protein